MHTALYLWVALCLVHFTTALQWTTRSTLCHDGICFDDYEWTNDWGHRYSKPAINIGAPRYVALCLFISCADWRFWIFFTSCTIVVCEKSLSNSHAASLSLEHLRFSFSMVVPYDRCTILQHPSSLVWFFFSSNFCQVQIDRSIIPGRFARHKVSDNKKIGSKTFRRLRHYQFVNISSAIRWWKSLCQILCTGHPTENWISLVMYNRPFAKWRHAAYQNILPDHFWIKLNVNIQVDWSGWPLHTLWGAMRKRSIGWIKTKF